MPTSKRLILWVGDGPLNARDQVIDYIETIIDEALRQAEEGDTALLNELMAYFRCLIGVLREAGGELLVSRRIGEWQQRTLAIYDAMPRLSADEIRNDRSFIVSVFDDLNELTQEA